MSDNSDENAGSGTRRKTLDKIACYVEMSRRPGHFRLSGPRHRFPVSLDDAWKDKITDVLWGHLEKKYILDFRKWKTKAFDGQFDKLLKGLKIYYEKPKE